MTSSTIQNSQVGIEKESSVFVRRILGGIEIGVLLAFYIYFMVHVVDAVLNRADYGAGLLAVSETMVVGLVLFRNSAQILSLRYTDWILAFGATLTPMLFRPVDVEATLWRQLLSLLMVGGVCFQIYAKFILGRRFGIVAANRGICVAGPYRIVRHPIYFGYFINYLAFLCISFSFWNLGVFVLIYALQIPRIFAEERILRQDGQYEAYCHQVSSRLIPGIL